MTEAIKIRLTGDSRSKLHTREVEVMLADEEPRADEVAKTTDRQKTNLVVETQEEAQALSDALKRVRDRDPDYCVWMTHNHKRAYRRVWKELREEMAERGWT